MNVLRPAVVLGAVTLFITLLLAFTAADVQKGKALFCDDTFAGSTRGKSCNSCHVNGKWLEHAGKITGWSIMGTRYKDLENAVNFMIETGLHGKAIDPHSEEMVNIVAYIKSL